jgi:hypothetical protein
MLLESLFINLASSLLIDTIGGIPYEYGRTAFAARPYYMDLVSKDDFNDDPILYNFYCLASAFSRFICGL